MPHTPSQRLADQIAQMVQSDEDYIVDPDGIDSKTHIVVNDFALGVWLCEHHNSHDMHSFTRIQRLDPQKVPQ